MLGSWISSGWKTFDARVFACRSITSTGARARDQVVTGPIQPHACRGAAAAQGAFGHANGYQKFSALSSISIPP